MDTDDARQDVLGCGGRLDATDDGLEPAYGFTATVDVEVYADEGAPVRVVAKFVASHAADALDEGGPERSVHVKHLSPS